MSERRKKEYRVDGADSERKVMVTVFPESDGGTGYSYELEHHVRHSPDGFAWGYGGSGPAELARCILIDYFGGDDAEERAEHLYQNFKMDVLATFPSERGWILSSHTIDTWVEYRRKALR